MNIDVASGQKESEPSDLKAKIAQFGFVAETDVKLKKVQEDLDEAKKNLEEWTKAEKLWASQRRLFKVMAESVTDMIVLLDANGNRSWNNPAFSHGLGYTAQEMAGAYGLEEVHPEDKERAVQALEHARSSRAPQQVEYRMRRKDGAWLELQTEIVPILTGDKVESLVLLAHDVTELKRLQEGHAAIVSQRTRAGIVETNAREIDQLLTAVFGNIAIARNSNPGQAAGGRLAEIERSLQKTRELIEQTFVIADEVPHEVKRQSIEPLTQEVVDVILRGTFIRAEYNFAHNLPELEIDASTFHQVLRAIVTNSVQSMEKGLIRISAEFISRAQLAQHPEIALRPGSYLCVFVRDQGHGMMERTLQHAFEPYFTTRSGSQGLGLTTALASMQRLGGTLLLDSAEYTGTTAYLYFPVTPSHAANRTGPLPSTSPVTPRRVLLMDDEQMILDIVNRMLIHLNYEVVTCTDGAQAIAAFAQAKMRGRPFDVVLMDLIVPSGVGGQDAVHTIRKIDPQAKVIASSGHLEHPVMVDPKKFGFVSVLEKPYKLEALRHVIDSVVEST